MHFLVAQGKENRMGSATVPLDRALLLSSYRLCSNNSAQTLHCQKLDFLLTVWYVSLLVIAQLFSKVAVSDARCSSANDVNSAFHPSRVGKSSTGLSGWG